MGPVGHQPQKSTSRVWCQKAPKGQDPASLCGESKADLGLELYCTELQNAEPRNRCIQRDIKTYGEAVAYGGTMTEKRRANRDCEPQQHTYRHSNMLGVSFPSHSL